ncbi:MAG: hypothetical protein KF775_03850 [Cyclobacteriaceae bacterium]|nr:hypothetical protein [Cyclobacteriaceae bacterium]
MKILKIPLIVLVLGMTTINSCTKDEVTKTEAISLSTEKSQYAPHEIVTITTEENTFSAVTQSAKINGVDVELAIDDNKAAFVLPNFENGTYNLTFSISNKTYDVPVKVIALTSISSPDTYFSEMPIKYQ